MDRKTKFTDTSLSPEQDFRNLLKILKKLRSPDGCLWDMRQKKEDVGRYLIEEAYEVIDAIDSGSPKELKEELGDLLFQILFLARISEENGQFDISDVIKEISQKMIRRHPHVFENEKVKDIGEIKSNWEDIKKQEKNRQDKDESFFSQIPRFLPSLLMAQKITKEASKVGFDWKNVDGVLKKIEEELTEFKAALKSKEKGRVKDEIGDIIFSLVNLSRFVEVSADEALRSSIKKFTDRFSYIEEKLKDQGKNLPEATLEEMDHLWNESKANVQAQSTKGTEGQRKN
ncbi:MAG: nucleoside triphosphate pyrophosphohydrolase [Syntrophales bacterium]|nr:nucleoside triphosphate pyrophosphohydrolase [Syntrophales bacterium]